MDSTTSKIDCAKLLSIIIPTYNELENIEQLVNEIHINLPEISIFIIDDSKTKEIGDLIFSKNIKAKYFHRSNANVRASVVDRFLNYEKPLAVSQAGVTLDSLATETASNTASVKGFYGS